jgi:hypothetical protein
MRLIITESQYKKILSESIKSSITNNIEKLKSFASNVIEKTQKDMNLNLKLLLIWGAGVGGFMLPLNDFIKTGDFNLTEFEVASILCATAALLFDENKTTVEKLLKRIKEDGNFDVFTKVFNKGLKLKETFLNFMDSLNMTFYNLTNILGYAFIIPILPMIWEMSNNGMKSENIKEIVGRLVSFGLVSVTGNTLRELFTRLIKRFKE